ncbi:3'-5' exonuclease [Phaeospirillum tilakii]|uniref:3'-5' exonuclease n=1 Tax=Phaeospirillum tilakii TaxID=741673 RepID=A0ABW5C7A9_9PROT
MSILFFDTETTGLPDKRAPSDAKHQPHVVQLAGLLTDDDGAERACLNLIINPGVPIPAGAAKVHGITDEVARQFGIHPKLAALAFRAMAAKADLLVAHNIEFDLALMATLFQRNDLEQALPERRFCTMEASTPILNLPPTPKMIAAGFNKPKPPKLEEAYRHFTGRDLVGAHDALADVRGCRDVYFAIVNEGA